MGLNLSVNILTSGFLVTVIIFFVLMAILLWTAFNKVVEVLEKGDCRSNRCDTLENAAKQLKTAYILAFIAAALTLILAIAYAGHELVWAPSEWIHAVLYLLTYVLFIITVVYAYLALNNLNTVGVTNKNGADGYIWAALLMSIFAFIGLTATGSGRIGMAAVRGSASKRLKDAEEKINQHLPEIRHKVEELHAAHLPHLHPENNVQVAHCDGQVTYATVPAAAVSSVAVPSTTHVQVAPGVTANVPSVSQVPAVNVMPLPQPAYVSQPLNVQQVPVSVVSQNIQPASQFAANMVMPQSYASAQVPVMAASRQVPLSTLASSPRF